MALWLGAQLEGLAGAGAEANLKPALGVSVKAAATGAATQQRNPEKEPPQHPLDT